MTPTHSSAFTSAATHTADAAGQPGKRIGRYAETRTVRCLRVLFALLRRHAPGAAARLAYAVLTRPPRVRERTWEAAIRAQAKADLLPFKGGHIALLSWGSGPAVLLVHGWGGRGTHLGKMVPALLAAGYRVVAFDAPAHGRSSGRSTTLPAFAEAVSTVAAHVGELHAVIAHSFGAAMTLWAQLDWGLTASRQVLLSSFEHCKWVADEFARLVQVPTAILDRGRELMVRRSGGRLDWERLSVGEMLKQTSVPTLLVHDQHDREVPIDHLFRVLATCASRPLELQVTEGLGHHRVMGDARVIARVLAFLQAEAV